MAILVDNNTKLVVQGLTGREGRFHSFRNKAYGTDLVAGVTPGKGGSDVEGVPIFDTVTEAVNETGANTSMVFVPPPFAADAILEAYDAGIETIITITEGIPAMDMARAVGYIRGKKNGRAATLIGPNCPGVITPGQANVGIIPTEVCEAGPIGLVSRSGTLVYQIVHELSQKSLGQSTCVGIGGDPIPGSDFIDVLALFNEDDQTELVVMVGEIGGDAEERAADWIKDNMTKPVVAYIAGFTAPEGKRMGHAGAIISGSKGTAQAKADALEAAGVRVGRNPTVVADLVVEARGG
jgi:succinyl-CoA synthetase alpha subunit